MGNLNLYVETAKKRSRELRERFLTQGQGQGVDLQDLMMGLTQAMLDRSELPGVYDCCGQQFRPGEPGTVSSPRACGDGPAEPGEDG